MPDDPQDTAETTPAGGPEGTPEGGGGVGAQGDRGAGSQPESGSLRSEVEDLRAKLEQAERRRADMQAEFDSLRTFKKENESAIERLERLGQHYDLDALDEAITGFPTDGGASTAAAPGMAGVSGVPGTGVPAADMQALDPLSQAVVDHYAAWYQHYAMADPARAPMLAMAHAQRYADHLQRQYPGAKIRLPGVAPTQSGLTEDQVRELARRELREAEEAGEEWEIMRAKAFEPLGGEDFAKGVITFPEPPPGCPPEVAEKFSKYKGLEMSRRQAYDIMADLTGIEDPDYLLNKIDPEGVRSVMRNQLKREVLEELRKESGGSMPTGVGGVPPQITSVVEGGAQSPGTARSNEALRKMGVRVGSDGPPPRH